MERNRVMQLVSYRREGQTDGSWRAGVEHGGRVVDVAALGHDGGQQTTTRQLLAAGPATLRKVVEQTRAALDAGPDAAGVFQTASVEIGPPVPDPIRSSALASIMPITPTRRGWHRQRCPSS